MKKEIIRVDKNSLTNIVVWLKEFSKPMVAFNQNIEKMRKEAEEYKVIRIHYIVNEIKKYVRY